MDRPARRLRTHSSCAFFSRVRRASLARTSTRSSRQPASTSCVARATPSALRSASHRGTFAGSTFSTRISIVEALRSVDAAVYLVHSMTADSHRYAQVEEESAERFRDAADCTRSRADRLPRRDAAARHAVTAPGEPPPRGRGPSTWGRPARGARGDDDRGRRERKLSHRARPRGASPVHACFQSGSATEASPWACETWAPPSSTRSRCRSRGAARSRSLGPKRFQGATFWSGRRVCSVRIHSVVSIPLVTPRLSSYWIRLVTRSEPHVAAELVEGLLSDILSRGNDIWAEMPDYRRTSFDDAVRTALKEEATALPTSTLFWERAMRSLAPAAAGRKG